MENNNAEKKMLKVGDTIYMLIRGSISERGTITRTTKTLAIIDEYNRFQIDYTHGIKAVGASTFSRRSYRLETQELLNLWNHNKLYSKVMRIDFKKLTPTQLEEILKITNNH